MAKEENYFDRIQKLQSRLATAKAEEKVAKQELEKIEKELSDKGIKVEDLNTHIKELEVNVETKKNLLDKRLKEAENELNAITE